MSGLPRHLEAPHTAHTRRRALHQPITHQCVEHMPPDTIELCIPLKGGCQAEAASAASTETQHGRLGELPLFYATDAPQRHESA